MGDLSPRFFTNWRAAAVVATPSATCVIEADISVKGRPLASSGDRINGDKITAAYENGVLTLSLPKGEEIKPKRIEIKPTGKVIEAKVK